MAERQRLESRLAERERATTAQMVIAVFPSLEGESLEDVSIRLAEKWKVGRKGVDNGVILLVFLKERKLRIEVGYGLEPVIPDVVGAAIIRDAIAPRFRERRYAAGLEAAVDEVFARIGGGAARRAPAPRSAADPATVLLLVLIFGVVGVAILSAIRAAQRRGYTADRRGWRSGGPSVWGGGGGGWSGGGGGGFSGGGGGFGGGGASGDW